MKIIMIILTMLFVYTIFSTIFHETFLVGKIGKMMGETNLYFFGYVAYINIFLLFYPLYTLYKEVHLRKKIDFYLGWIFIFVALILFNALMIKAEYRGFLGLSLIDFFHPLIGQVGLWILWLMMVLFSLVFLLDDDFHSSVFSRVLAVLAEIKSGELSWERVGKMIAKRLQTIKEVKNPFAFASMEEEMMINQVENITRQQTKVVPPPIEKKAVKKPKSAPLTEAHKREILERTQAVKKIDDSVIKEISELELVMEKEQIKVEEKKENKIKEKRVKTEKVVKIEKDVKTTPSSVKIVKELEENTKLMAQMDKGEVVKPKNFKLPKLSFLQQAPKTKTKINEAEIDRKIAELLAKLEHFKVEGDVIRTYSGPLVTTFEFKPAPNVKISRILNLQDDLAMALSAETVRIQAPIPGRDVVGIEIPNETIETIYLREILESDIFKESSSPLTVALGKDIVGNPFITDIKKLPHLLIAGTTGSGKSVGINAMILSLLYRNDPDQLKLMLIDPKMLEFSIYNDIPHLITPVITEPKKAIVALANMVGEMERRYRLMADNRTKNIDNYNEKVIKDGSADAFPFIVVVIDELADLMMNGGKEVEYSIARLAQMARASGIHLIVATQRPSVDVVTGLIKANLPSRLSYRVGQRIDSKVILDAMGAESLLGRGDGLFTPPASTGLVRLHAPWNSEEEVEEIVEFLKAQRLPEYDESFLVAGNGEGNGMHSSTNDVPLDALYEDAKEIVLTENKTSISYLQRKLQIGYNRSANIIEQLEQQGILTSPNTKGNRDIV